MPLYLFDVAETVDETPGSEPIDLPDLSAAMRVRKRAAAEMVTADIAEGREGPLRVRIRGETGDVSTVLVVWQVFVTDS